MTDSERLDLILTKITKLDEDVQGIKAEVQGVKQSMEDIIFTLGDEIRANTQLIAEGNYKLSRDIQETKKYFGEVAMLSIKVRTIESEIREIKRRLA